MDEDENLPYVHVRQMDDMMTDDNNENDDDDEGGDSDGDVLDDIAPNTSNLTNAYSNQATTSSSVASHSSIGTHAIISEASPNAIPSILNALNTNSDDDSDSDYRVVVNLPDGQTTSVRIRSLSPRDDLQSALEYANWATISSPVPQEEAEVNEEAAESSNLPNNSSNPASGEQSSSNSNNNPSTSSKLPPGMKSTFWFGSSSFSLRSRKEVATIVNEECCRGGPTPDLDAIMDTLFNPKTPIDNSDTIEWIRWLIAGGRTPQEFVKIVRSYDNHAKCGLVWVPHVVAYRCRTCGISPCMSICRDCFKKGNHTNHDFNMFLSQAGGACDCGDTSVMKAEGFCSDHGINNRANKDPVPNNLLAVAEAIMPKLLFRLLQHFREHSDNASSQSFNIATYSCEEYANMLIELNNMGEIMRKVMTRALINPEVYTYYTESPCLDNAYGRFIKTNRDKYLDALQKFPRPEPPDDYKDLPALGEKLVHKTLLEEFIFWTFKFEFPQNLVCFLLNMLPDQDYKEHLTRTFVMHYSRIPSVLEMSRDPDTLSNRVVHMSVQLFSNESLALKMVNELSLLHVMIISLKLMMSKILIQNTLHNPATNFHFVIDCTRQVMKDHCYWPLVSDFNNVLSHESVALVFLRDDNLIDMWFQFLSMLQGMNVNVRETNSHVEFEPNSYYAAFSCELEASAYPMWSIISHLQDGTHAHLAKKIIKFCVNTLHEWLDAIYFLEPKLSQNDMMQASFHFPLHRYLAAFICQAVTKMGMSLSDVLPRPCLLPLLMIHPLRVQSFFYEILAGKWVRNGLQIKGQAMTYIQANFCNSMADMDLFFLQVCATNLPQCFFLQNVIELFGVAEWLELAPLKQPQKAEQSSMLDGFLTFLATLVTSRTNLGNDEATQCIIEISALLATENKTHSQLLELMPERSGNVHTKNFETFLKKLSVYKAPSAGSENLEQGLFTPIDEVWEEYYDPLHVLLRAVHRRDFQSSLDRFTNYVKSKNKMPASGNLWPPFRLPKPVAKAFTDPSRILNSNVFHSTILSILYRAVHSRDVSEHLLALAVFLLEIAVENIDENAHHNDKAAIVECEPKMKSYLYAGQEPPRLFQCYPTDNLSWNLRHVVKSISLKNQDAQATSNYRSNNYYSVDYDVELDSDSSSLRMLGASDDEDTPGAYGSSPTPQITNAVVPMLMQGMEVVLPPDLSVVPEQGLVIRQDSQDDDSLRENENAVEYPFRLQPITLPESGMEVAIRRDLLLAETRRNENNSPSQSHRQSNHGRSGESSSLRLYERRAERQQSFSSEARSQSAAGGSGAAAEASGGSGAVGSHYQNQQRMEILSPTTTSNNSGLILPFSRVQPVAVPNTSGLMDIVPSTTAPMNLRQMNDRRSFESGGGGPGLSRQRAVDSAMGSRQNNDEVQIDESILSLLLKIHSQLSGILDSFSLCDDPAEMDENSENKTVHSSNDDSSSSCPMEVDGCEASTSSAAAAAGSESPSTSQRFNTANIKVSESRIGDGPFFIGNLLKKIAKKDPQCAQSINEIRMRLWPNQREKQAEQKAREAKEKEERRKRARERQQKMMQDFANKQKEFMKSAAQMDCGYDEDEEDMYEVQPREKEYDCIICNCTTPSTESNPIGLVVLVESSGILGHRRRVAERLPLPLNAEDEERLKFSTRLAHEFQRRAELLSLKFGEESWYLSNNMFFDNGVHVQSCGHHVHLSCLDSYLKTLYATQRQQVHERGEFYCPVCRQLSNSVLPLSPQVDRPTPMVRSGNRRFEHLVADLTNLIKENERPPGSSKLCQAMGRAMEDMTNITYRKMKRVPPTFRSLFIFVTSIARTNLESEIIQRGGSLVSTNATRYKPKRDCIVPLLHVLSVHVRVLVEWPLWQSWASLAGLPVTDVAPVPAHCIDMIPNILADPISLLLKFILLAPLHLDQEYFTCMVRVMYNLLYYQIVLQLCMTLSDPDVDYILETFTAPPSAESDTRSHRNSVKNSYLGRAMALVLRNTNRLAHLRKDSIASAVSQSTSTSSSPSSSSSSASSTSAAAAAAAAEAEAASASPSTSSSSGAKAKSSSVHSPSRSSTAATVFADLESVFRTSDKQTETVNFQRSSPSAKKPAIATNSSGSTFNIKVLESQLQTLCLPFLRIAALLRLHLYHNDMPEISQPSLEFVRLVYYLELVTDSMDWDCFNASKGLGFVPGTEEQLPKFWCSQLMDIRPPTDTIRELVLVNQHGLWQQPKLLELPREYERLFTYYHERHCLNCYKVPKESSICLLCGTIVCLKQNCCAENDCCEAVRHTMSCGGGIGIFLVVTSTYIIVIRGRRACLWGSLYLDDFDEEDRDLKRGKPLYLSKDRFNLLESQWLSHKFAHTKHTWVFHRDLL